MSSAYNMHPKKSIHKSAARATVSELIYERANINIKTQPRLDFTLSDTTLKFNHM